MQRHAAHVWAAAAAAAVGCTLLLHAAPRLAWHSARGLWLLWRVLRRPRRLLRRVLERPPRLLLLRLLDSMCFLLRGCGMLPVDHRGQLASRPRCL